MAQENFKLDFDWKKFQRLINKYNTWPKQVEKAAAHSLVAGRKKARTRIWDKWKTMVSSRGVPQWEFYTRLDKFTKEFLKGSIDHMQIIMDMPQKGFGLIRFVKSPANKKPMKQKGVSIDARKKLKIEVAPGQVKEHPKAFIAKGQGMKKDVISGGKMQNYQVFMRVRKVKKKGKKGKKKGKKGRGKLWRLATFSISSKMKKHLPLLKNEIERTMRNEFYRVLRRIVKGETVGAATIRPPKIPKRRRSGG